MKTILYILSLFLFLSPVVPLAQATEAPELESKATITVYNVGVGQCCAVEMYDAVKKKRKNMLIGLGIEETDVRVTESEARSVSSPSSGTLLTPLDYQEPSSLHPLSSQELVKELRTKFRQEGGQGIILDTIILTQPLKDRGLLMDLLTHETDRVGQVCMAGRPESYYPDRLDALRSWLKERQLKKTKIHFLAVKRTQAGSLFLEENRKYRPSWFTHPVKAGEEMLNFRDIKVSFLAVNPTHFQGQEAQLLSMSGDSSPAILRSAYPVATVCW